MNPSEIKVTTVIDDVDFSRTLRAYAAVSKTEPGKLVVRKALFIDLGAFRNTPRADPDEIKSQLEASEVHRLTLTKRGKFSKNKSKNRTFSFGGSMNVGNQRVFRILRARLQKSGKSIPDKETLRDMAVQLIKARLRSVAFLASGWIFSIKNLSRIAAVLGVKGIAPRMTERQQAKLRNAGRIGKLFTSNLKSANASATIVNAAHAKHDLTGALEEYGQPALEQAFAEETASTLKQIEDRYRELARRSGIRTN